MTENLTIPFNRPYMTGKELWYIAQAINLGQVSGDGPFTKKCHGLLESIMEVPRTLLTTSCTHALEMAAILLEIKPGDEVIVPSFTFVSTPNAFVMRGAKPVFCDIREDTLNIDEQRLETLITPRTRAIVPVHYGGVGCEMNEILSIAARHGVAVVEDNAHGLFGRYRGKYLGTFGCMATQSFHETKNVQSGEGGALIINDRSFVQRAEIIREKGTDRSRFFRAEVDKYGWVDIGSSYLISDILAAFLYAQLEERDSILDKRSRIWHAYYRELSEWGNLHGIELPHIPSHCDSSYHLFHILLPDQNSRQRLINHLKSKDIHAVFHYLPLHISLMGSSFGGYQGECPVCESVSDRLLRLPFYNGMTEEEQQRVIETLLEWSP